MAVVVVVDLDGDGDVEVDATFDATVGLSGRNSRHAPTPRRPSNEPSKSSALAYDIVDVLPRGHADRADQLTRSAESAIRNSPKGRDAYQDDLSVNRGVHLHVAVAVKVHDHDDDHVDINANQGQPPSGSGR
jgi:hypothetical protein